MTTTTLQQPPNGVLCFNTPIGRDRVTAFVSESSLRARYGSTLASDQDMTLLPRPAPTLFQQHLLSPSSFHRRPYCKKQFLEPLHGFLHDLSLFQFHSTGRSTLFHLGKF